MSSARTPGRRRAHAGSASTRASVARIRSTTSRSSGARSSDSSSGCHIIMARWPSLACGPRTDNAVRRASGRWSEATESPEAVAVEVEPHGVRVRLPIALAKHLVLRASQTDLDQPDRRYVLVDVGQGGRTESLELLAIPVARAGVQELDRARHVAGSERGLERAPHILQSRVELGGVGDMHNGPRGARNTLSIRPREAGHVDSRLRIGDGHPGEGRAAALGLGTPIPV